MGFSRLEWFANSFSRGSFRSRDPTRGSCIAGSFFTTEPPGKPKVISYCTANYLQIWGFETTNSDCFTQFWGSGAQTDSEHPSRLGGPGSWSLLRLLPGCQGGCPHGLALPGGICLRVHPQGLQAGLPGHCGTSVTALLQTRPQAPSRGYDREGKGERERRLQELQSGASWKGATQRCE